MGAVVSSPPAAQTQVRVLVRGRVGMGYRPSFAGSLGEEGISADGERPLIVVADARLDNRAELLAALRLDETARDGRLTDAALIAHLYRRWGVEGVARLLGAFAFVLWDPAKGRLFCARDQMGARSLYYQRTRRRFVFASEVKQLLAVTGSPPPFNEVLIGLHLAARAGPQEMTFFEGIGQLPPGHWMVVTPDGERLQRYWDIDPQRRIRYRDDAEYAEHFRELFVEAVRCRLRPYESTGVLLSGGLDSSAVASVAAWLHEQGEQVPWPLHTFSWLYDELASVDEREYSAAVNEAYGLVAHGLIGDDKWPLQDDPEGITDLDEPFTGHFIPGFKDMFRNAQERGIEVLLTGHPGDNLVGGNVFDYPDLLRRGRWIRLVCELRRHSRRLGANGIRFFWRASLKPAVPMWARRAYHLMPQTGGRTRLPVWIASEFAQRVGLEQLIAEEMCCPEGLSIAKATRHRSIFSPYALKAIIQQDRLATRREVDFRHPWLDRRLAEFVMAVPTDQTNRGGEYKVILRNALRGILPEKVRTRQGKSYPLPLADRGLRERERAKVEDLLTNTRMAQYGWVVEEPMQEHYARYASGDPGGDRFLWPVITLEFWLREHF
jgi:asparagine synthase (glutamine-hydrolysing)